MSAFAGKKILVTGGSGFLGQTRRCLDTSRAKEKFGFVARPPFEEGLRRTIAWYEQARPER